MKNSKTKKKVLVIAHDAGGAEIIGAYVQKHTHQINFQSYVAGPAKDIFRREKIPFSRIQNNRAAIACIVKKNTDIKYAIVGTMWHTHIELIALQELKRANLYTIAYLDSWVNYRERFDYPKRGWQKNLPDEIWVGDTEAQKMATRLFPTSLPIKLVRNQYFTGIRKRYRALRSNAKHNRILFLSNSSDEPTLAFSWLLGAISDIQNKPKILVRFHPFDKRKWFSAFKENYGPQIEISKEQDLMQDLAQARIVVGIETTALVVALLCNLPTICIKSKKTKLILPFQKIHTVVNVVELKKQLQHIFVYQKRYE